MLGLWRRWSRAYVGLLWELDGFITRLWWRRRVQIRGRCEGCGECCRRLVLWSDAAPVRDHETFQRMVHEDPHTYSRFFPIAQNAAGDLVFMCSKLGEDNRCTVYAERPVICRRYPEPRMFVLGAGLPEGCTYEVLVQIRDPK